MPAGRPLQFDPEHALDAAMQTFWSRGYEGTALPNLLAATGLSRSSLYQAFGSKQQLFERCLMRYRGQLVAAMSAKLAAAPSAFDFLRGVLDDIVGETAAQARLRGCLVLNTAREFSCRDRRIAKLVHESTVRMAGLFEEAIRRAQGEGDIPVARDARVLAAFFLTNVSGLRNLIQARMDRALVDKIAEHTLRSLRAG
jgi:TetR/AcrR family transcriptional repressor of nem operon